MAYPDKINALVDVTADQTLAAGGHAARHNDVNEALDELKAVFTAPAANELALRPDGTNNALVVKSDGDLESYRLSGTVQRLMLDVQDQRLIMGAYWEGGVGQYSFINSTNNAETGATELLFQTGGTERMRIASGGSVLIGTTTTGSAGAGDLVVNGGVFLGGNAAANELDDYEEGTWTPTYEPESGSFATMVMDTNCRYVKIGNLVTVGGVIRTDNVDATGASGDLQISGLPFTPRVMIGTAKPNCFNWTNAPDAMIVDFPTNVIKMRKRASGTDNHIDLQVSDMTTGALNDRNALTFSLTYAV